MIRKGVVFIVMGDGRWGSWEYRYNDKQVVKYQNLGQVLRTRDITLHLEYKCCFNWPHVVSVFSGKNMTSSLILFESVWTYRAWKSLHNSLIYVTIGDSKFWQRIYFDSSSFDPSTFQRRLRVTSCHLRCTPPTTLEDPTRRKRQLDPPKWFQKYSSTKFIVHSHTFSIQSERERWEKSIHFSFFHFICILILVFP